MSTRARAEGEAQGPGAGRALRPLLSPPLRARGRRGTRLRVLRGWAPRRWAAAAAAAAAAALLLCAASAPFAAGPGWAVTALAFLAAGSAAVGMLVGTYVGAPVGARPTVCDLRWPLLGTVGLSLATAGNPDGLLMQLFSGLPEAAVRWAVQPALAAAALAIMAAALHRRLGIEHEALSDPAGGPSCTGCRPLFPR